MHSPKSRRLHSAHAAAASLPDELIFDVVSRLPVKSVCLCRSVSRGWNLLVSDPAFVAAHRDRARHGEPLLVLNCLDGYRDTDRDLKLMDMDGNVVRTMKDVGGCGLASTSTDDLVCVTDGKSGGTRVIDPAIGKVLVVCPKLEVEHHHSYKDGIVGFGRAVMSGAYKLVHIVSSRPYCEVFTLGDDTGWRRSPSPSTCVRNSKNSSVSLNGVIYFLALPSRNNYSLLCFDIDKEEWRKAIEGPPKGLGSPSEIDKVRITELNGALCMVVFGTYARASANFWLLTSSDKNTWINAYTIWMAGSYEYFPLMVTPDGGKLIFYCYSLEEGDILQVYDPHTQTCRTLRKLDYIVDKIGLCCLHLDRCVQVKI